MAKDREVKVRFSTETEEFTAGIKQMNSDMRLLRSELKLNATQLKGNASNTELLKERQKLLESELEKSRNKVELTNEKLQKAKEIYGDNSDEVRNLEVALSRARIEEQEIQNQIDTCTTQIQQNEAAVKENESAYGQLTSTIDKQKQEFEDLKKEYTNVVLAQGRNSDEAKELENRMSQLSSEIRENVQRLEDAEEGAEQYEQAIRGAAQGAETASNGGFTVLKGILADLGSELISKCIEGVKEFAGSVLETGMSFETGMSTVSAISGATGESLEQLKDKAAEMGAKTKYTSTEAAEAMQYMAMAGWEAGEMLDGIDGIMNLAAASGEELGTVSDIVTDALTAFGLEAKDSAHFADVLAAASAKSNTNVAMLGESFQYVAPVAGSLQYSIEDTSLALGLMANSGIKASSAGTALRSLLTNMAKPTDAMSEAMDYLGISLQNSDGSTKELNELMKDLRGSFGECQISADELTANITSLDERLAAGEITEKQYNKEVEKLTENAYGAEGALKAKYAATLAGKTGMAGLLAIVNSSDEDFEKLETAINGATDAENGYSAASEMAATQLDNLQGDVDIMKSAFDGFKEKIYDDVSPALRGAAQDVTNEVVPALSSMYEGLKEGIGWMKEHSTAIEGVVVVLGALVTGIAAYNIQTGIKAAMDAVGATTLRGLVAAQLASAKAQLAANLAMFACPITWIVAGIAALAGGLILAYKKSETFRNGVNAVGETLKNGFLKIVDGVKGVIDDVANTFQKNGGGIKGAAAAYVDLLILPFKLGYNVLNKLTGGKLGEMKDVAVSKFNDIKEGASEKLGKLKGIASTALTHMKNTFTSNGGGIKGAAAVLMEGTRLKFLAGFNLLNKLTGGKLGEMLETVVSKMKAMKEKFQNAVDKIKEIFNFKLKAPDIKMPSITVSYNKSGNLAKAAQFLGLEGLPKFNIKWNANGAILTKPTLFGFANGQIQGGGEAGPEAVLPISTLEEYIGNKMAEFVDFIPDIDYDKLGKVLANANSKLNITATVSAREAERFIKKVR